MNKFQIAALLSVSAIASSAMATTYTLGDVFSGISKVVSKATAPSGNAAEETVSIPSGVLVKDLPDLQKLSDKAFLRGLAKIEYGEIIPGDGKNRRTIGFDAGSAPYALGVIIQDYQEGRNSARSTTFQKDALTGKVYDRSSTLTAVSNPYANQTEAFDLSKLNESTRNNMSAIYTYTLKTHIKIPNEFVNKSGKFVFETHHSPVMLYNGYLLTNPKKKDNNSICYQMINGAFLSDAKASYSVKKGNIVDYSLACYIAGNTKPNTIQDIKQSSDLLPRSWTVYSVPDPLAKDAGQSYTITNRDMFLYENEVYPAR